MGQAPPRPRHVAVILLGASGGFWETLGVFFELLVALEAFGTIWELLGSSGSFWELLEASGRFWETLRLLGASASLVVNGIGLGPGVAHPFYIFQLFQTIIGFSIILVVWLSHFSNLCLTT